MEMTTTTTTLHTGDAIPRVGESNLHNDERVIVFDNVSKFYGDILGVNRINLTITPGITSLVGPNGSGKTTLMNLMTGLLQPTRGRVSVLGIAPSEPEKLFRQVGYCAQFDSFPRGLTGYNFINAFAGLHGYDKREAESRSWRALERVSLTEAAHRKVAGYSKGMRQRARLAQSIMHDPAVLVLDEPLNGLDPLARAETISLFRQLATEGLHLIISSHILHEVDMMSDRVVLINNGYVVASGGSAGSVREEITTQPLEIFVRCDSPKELAAELLRRDAVREARLLSNEATRALDAGAIQDGETMRGVIFKTRDADKLYLTLNAMVVEGIARIETVKPVDDDLHAVYGYLIGAQPTGGGASK